MNRMEGGSSVSNLVKNLPTFEGDPNDFPDWKRTIVIEAKSAISGIWVGIAQIMRGVPKPEDEEKRLLWESCNQALYGVLHHLVKGQPAGIIERFGPVSDEDDGNGAGAWKALVEKYEGDSKSRNIDLHDQLGDFRMLPNEDPDHFFSRMYRLRDQLNKLGEVTSDTRLLSLALKRSNPEYQIIRDLDLKSNDLTLESCQEAMRRLWQQRGERPSSPNQSTSTRGQGMVTSTNIPTCGHCGKRGHMKKDCWKLHGRNNNFREKKPEEKKWCSYHKSSTHSDAECYHQNKQTAGNVNTASTSKPTIIEGNTSFTGNGSRILSTGGTIEMPTNGDDQLADVEDEDHDTFYTSEAYTASGAITRPLHVTMLVDSGADNHFIDSNLTPRINNFVAGFKKFSKPFIITCGGNAKVQATGCGVIQGIFKHASGKRVRHSLPVIIAPGLGQHLFSVTKIAENGAVNFHISKDESYLEKRGMKFLVRPTGAKKNKLYFDIILDRRPSNEVVSKVRSSQTEGGSGEAMVTDVDANIWHRRLGHPNDEVLNAAKNTQELGVKFKNITGPCSTCRLNKSTQQPRPKKANLEAEKPLELVHTDILGPIQPPSLGGFRFVTKFSCQTTKFRAVYFSRSKNEAANKLRSFNQDLAIPNGLKIKRISSDGGGEYVARYYQELCKELGILQELSAPYTPQQNGTSERDGRTIMAITRCLINEAKLPHFLWNEVCATAVYLSNRIPHKTIGMDTPYHRLFGKHSSLSHLRVIGARAFVHVEGAKDKLNERAWEGKLVGYDSQSRTYRIYKPSTRKVIRSRNVTFIESPSKNMRDDSNLTSKRTNVGAKEKSSFTNVEDGDVFDWPAEPGSTKSYIFNKEVVASSSAENKDRRGEISELMESAEHRGETSSLMDNSEHKDGAQSQMGHEESKDEKTESIRTRSMGPRSQDEHEEQQLNPRQQRELKRLASYNSEPEEDASSHFLQTESFIGNAWSVGLQPIIPPSEVPTPNNYEEAVSSQNVNEWRTAMDKELASLRQHDVADLIPESEVPEHSKVIGSRWVFRVKSDGRFKARLVAQGYHQRVGIDCNEIYAPVCRMVSQRILLATAAERNWTVMQMDVVTAFLQSRVQEDVYVKQAPGYEARDPVSGELQVMKLKKSLYGLRQSPLNWFNTINDKLQSIGFKPTGSDPCMYIHGSCEDYVMMTLYVDDILLTGESPATLTRLKTELTQQFDIADMGEADQVVGMDINRDSETGTIRISQEGYVRTLLKKFDMEECKAVDTPGVPAQELLKCPKGATRLNFEETRKYQAIVGSLIYLSSCTRWDICYAVNQLTRAMSEPYDVHMTAAKRVIRYLRGKTNVELVYRKSGNILTGFCDSSYITPDPDNLRSSSGYIFYLGNNIISFASRMQRLVALSSTESEIIALTEATKEAKYLVDLLGELGIIKTRQCFMQVDNMGAILLTEECKYSPRTKHIGVRLHALRQAARTGLIKLRHVSSSYQRADVLSKFLRRVQHIRAMEIIEGFVS